MFAIVEPDEPDHFLNWLHVDGDRKAAAGVLGTGLHTTVSSALVDADGRASEALFASGAARQGTLLESIAVPKIREQAAALARLLSEQDAVGQERAAA